MSAFTLLAMLCLACFGPYSHLRIASTPHSSTAAICKQPALWAVLCFASCQALSRSSCVYMRAVEVAEQEVAKEIVHAFRRTAGNSSCAADVRGGLAAITTSTLRSWLAAEVHAAAAEATAAAPADSATSAAGRGEAEQSGNSSGSSGSPKGAEQDSAQSRESTAKQGSSGGGAADGGNVNGTQNGPAAAELRRFQARVSAYQVRVRPAHFCSFTQRLHNLLVLASICCHMVHLLSHWHASWEP